MEHFNNDNTQKWTTENVPKSRVYRKTHSQSENVSSSLKVT